MKIQESDLDLNGKRVLITGAASGIGAAMAKTFSAHNATVILADIDPIGLERVSKEISASQTVMFNQNDLTSIEEMCVNMEAPDIVLNNAGILWAGPFEEMSSDEITKIINVNLLGPVHIAQALGKKMLTRGSGVIVNTSSQLAFHGSAERAVYASTKAAIAQFTKSIAAEWAPKGIRVVAIAPGRTLTNINASFLNSPKKQQTAIEAIPAGRIAEAHEMARLALLLSSDVLSYVVGETVVSDGGYILL
ncbi:MAG: hypothetical protein CMM39_08015 [Rhodospirillaceae bacterium]|nr:hypothetical protein [Rhodospirillaceae bacterium]MDG1274995.1 SDR family NAD(P)-dependent oxidoreductase [Alphaproteobacteria bacterium]MDG1887454.1 SDR family NAD(P)-dependent oxidoreductase [Alphaproteobacteria bacterium]